MQRMRNSAMAAGVVVLVGAGAASADIGDPVVVFEASSDLGSGSYTVNLDDGNWMGDSWHWSSNDPIQILSDGGEVILTLDMGTLFIHQDPLVGLGFAVTAGASDTSLTITSSTVSFPTIFGAEGRASAGITLTESDGNTATLTGNEPGGTLFTAQYNGFNVFDHLLVGPFNENDAWGTTSATDESPNGGGFSAIGDVSDISSRWSFTLSANDQASGTSVFVVVPAPASLAVVIVGAMTGFRRRR